MRKCDIMIKIDEIKKLIQSGFDDELIAIELDIPLEQVRQWKKEVQDSMQSRGAKKLNRDIGKSVQKSVNKSQSGVNVEVYKAHVKMEKLRKRFEIAFYGKKDEENKEDEEKKKPKQLSPIEIEKMNATIEKVIATIDESIQKMEGLSRNEKREIGKYILKQLRKIEDYQLSIEQAEKLYCLSKSKFLIRLKVTHDDSIDEALKGAKRKVATQFIQAIGRKQDECNDIQELQALLEMITEKMSSEGPMVAGGLKISISNRIMKLQQQQSLDRMRDIPPSIDLIISSLASGKIDIQKANDIINEEAQRRVESSPKTKFALTREAQRRQVLMQIKMAIVEKANRYLIQNPETVILQLQELCGIGQEEAIRIVVGNCIGRKDYQTARSVCDKNEVKNEYGFTVKSIASLRDEINHAEFGDIVLEGIRNAKTHEEERAYIEMIEKALNAGHVRLTAISLGKSEDGLRNITLADIWEDEKVKKTTYR